MSKSTPTKCCYPNGHENDLCPNCGQPMPTVDYYTARPLRQEEIQRDINSKTVITTYTDVSPHQGVICLRCVREHNKTKRAAGLLLLLGGGSACSISMLVGLVLSNLAQSSGGDVGASLGLPMALMCIFFLLAIVGLALFRGSTSLDPSRNYTQDQLFPIFFERLRKEYPPIRVVYLSPQQVNQMKRN